MFLLCKVPELCTEDPFLLLPRGPRYFLNIDVSGVQVQELCVEDPVPLSPYGLSYLPTVL